VDRDVVSAWAETGGIRLGPASATGSLEALEPLGAIVGEASVVGIGVPTHGARELTVLTHWIVRFLVERLGFRAVAMDEESNVGDAVDAYVQQGEGDPRAVVGSLSPHHRTVEVLDIVKWMRAFTQGTPDDPVRFVGLESDGPDVDGDDSIAGVESRLADAVLRWHDNVGSKLVVISGATHSAVAPDRTVTIGPEAVTHRNAGSRLRARLGDGYVSLGLTFHHGAVDLGSGPHDIPVPPARVVESTLGDPSTPVLFDLHAHLAEPVRRWLDAPATMRLVGPAFDPDEPSKALMSGGSLAQWFESLVHVGTVGPVTLLAGAETPDP
jgi:erythromycin esterase